MEMLPVFFYFLVYDTEKKKQQKRKQESPSAWCWRAEIGRLPQQNDFRTFCMSEETEKVYQKLEEIISIS